MAALVFAEHDNDILKDVTLATVTAAKTFGDVDILVAGSGSSAVADHAATIHGVRAVIHVEDDLYRHSLAEELANLVVALSSDYKAVLAPASTMGKNFMPRVAAQLDVAQISDIVGIIDENTFTRPIYAGNAIATVTSRDAFKVITVRTTAFDKAEIGSGKASLKKAPVQPAFAKSSYVRSDLSGGDRPELTSAKIIISGGRGMGSGENFSLIDKIADKLGAAVGASRAAVDAGFVPNDYQVGQTGKIVAPDLYIAVGISGAIQHLAGMKDSKIIVAINKDEDAPIFQVADYGLVADLFEVLPALEGVLD